jgi:hypothetical protein
MVTGISFVIDDRAYLLIARYPNYKMSIVAKADREDWHT